jgi:hypothetical protein
MSRIGIALQICRRIRLIQFDRWKLAKETATAAKTDAGI